MVGEFDLTLQTQILRFLRLEVFAAELYRQHTKHVPERLRPLMAEFERVEMVHVDRFTKLYTLVCHKPAPRCWPHLWCARFMAWILVPLGWRIIFRFECWVESRAIAEYRAALHWVMHADTRAAIAVTLADEEKHAPYFETLKKFCADEERHIKEMRGRLSN